MVYGMEFYMVQSQRYVSLGMLTKRNSVSSQRNQCIETGPLCDDCIAHYPMAANRDGLFIRCMHLANICQSQFFSRIFIKRICLKIRATKNILQVLILIDH